MTTAADLSLTAVPDIPLIKPGDPLAAIFIEAIERAGIRPRDDTVFVIAQKVVSKAAGRYVNLQDIQPSARALELAVAVDKDPRLVEVILSESAEVLRASPGVLVVVHRLGYVMANAGIDRSNIESGEQVLLLPEDSDRDCAELRSQLESHFSVRLAVIVNDSVGRAWRVGSVGIALGVAGLPATVDLRGQRDLYDRPLQVTEVGLADEIAAAASLLMGQADQGQPLVLVTGLSWQAPASDGRALLRAKAHDLFR